MSSTVVTSENLAEFNASRMAATSAPAPTEAVEKTEPVSEQTLSEVAPPETEETAEQDEQKPVNQKVEKRFSELTKQREDARRDAAKEREAREVIEAKLKDYEAKLTPQAAAKSDQEPQPTQFNDAYEYAKALAQWSTETALRNRDQQEANRKASAERDTVIKGWKDRLTAAKAEMTDYDDTIASSNVVVSDPVRDAILESDVGPKILYHLAKNPEVAEALGAKSINAALREIGRLEAKLSGTDPVVAKPAESPSRAPAPINPIRATKSSDSPVDSKGEYHGTFLAYKAARAAGKI